MRLFLAVELDRAVIDEAQRAIEVLDERLRKTIRASWIPPKNMHLTVRFIGHVPDEHVKPVVEAVGSPLELGAFDVALGQCGVFPPHGPPRVLWIGLDQGLLELRRLHEAFNDRLAPLGFEPEKRPFSAHLTLARMKDAPRGSAVVVRDAVSRVRVAPLRSRISDVVLFQSRLSPKVALYEPLLRVPLFP